MRLIPYRPKPPAWKVALVILIVFGAARLALLIAELFFGLHILGRITLPLLNFIVLGSAFFCVKKHRAAWYSILSVLLLTNIAVFLLGNDGAEYYFSSPQHTNTLVVREQSALISSGQVELYRREYGVFARRLDYDAGARDNYHPFAGGQYRLEWPDEQTVLLSYYDGTGYRELTIDFSS